MRRFKQCVRIVTGNAGPGKIARFPELVVWLLSHILPGKVYQNNFQSMIKRKVLLPGPFHPINSIYLKNNGLLCYAKSVKLALSHAVFI